MLGKPYSFVRICCSVVVALVMLGFMVDKASLESAAKLAGAEDVVASGSDYIASFTPQQPRPEYTFQSPGKVIESRIGKIRVWVSCAYRGPLYAEVYLGKDEADTKRVSRFYKDYNIPDECQSKTTRTYANSPYHRGHLIAANHVDDSYISIKSSNTITNVVPQHKTSNLGAWYSTEKLTECYREHHRIRVLAGAFYGRRTSAGRFIESHGISIPKAMWKLLLLDDAMYAAWVIPNNETATRHALDSFRVSLSELMAYTQLALVDEPERFKSVALIEFNDCHLS